MDYLSQTNKYTQIYQHTAYHLPDILSDIPYLVFLFNNLCGFLSGILSGIFIWYFYLIFLSNIFI